MGLNIPTQSQPPVTFLHKFWHPLFRFFQSQVEEGVDNDDELLREVIDVVHALPTAVLVGEDPPTTTVVSFCLELGMIVFTQ